MAAGLQSVNDVLGRLHSLFRSCLNFQSISPHLRERNLITYDEWQVIANKGSHDSEVDEFLKVLPHKGRNCLNQLIECLQLSLDHAGHKDLLVELKKQVDQQSGSGASQDEFKRAVSTIDRLYTDQKELLFDMQIKLEEKEKEISNMKTKLEEHKSEICAMKVKLDEKDTENRECKADCDRSIHQLNDQLSAKDTEIENLKTQLKEMEDACTPETELTDDELLQDDQNPEMAQNISFDDKMKEYRKKLASYRRKCRSLEEEKKTLTKSKIVLEGEVDELKKELELEPGSRNSYGSYRSQRLSMSCSDLQLLIDDYHEGKGHVEERTPVTRRSRFATLTSYFSPKGTAKRTVSMSLPRDGLEDSEGDYRSSSPTSPILMPENIHEDEYVNPLHQGWLLKEGGKKKYWKKRWCMLLPSKYFCYFDGKDDPAKKKRPIGIIPITEEMEVVDCLKENFFIIKNKRNDMIKACKLDKNKYVQGRHRAYNLQAPSDDDKKEWIEKFQLVLPCDQISHVSAV